MPVRDIGARLKLDGEKEFDRAIKEASRELRVMKSELNAEAAAFEASGNKMKANEARAKSLRKQQEQQRKVVAALEQAVADAAEQYGETSAKTDGYRIKLAKAREELTKMEAAERQAIDANKKAGKSVADLKKEIGQDWKTVTQGAGNALKDMGAVAAGVFATVAAGATTAGKSLYTWATDAAHDADDLLTLSAQTGIGVETLQQWQYAEQFIDTSAESIIDSVKKLRTSMRKDNKEFNAEMLTFGVRVKDTAGKYRDAQEVFWDIIDTLHDRALNDPDFDPYSSDVADFLQNTVGKSYDELMPLILAGRQEWERVMGEAVEKDLVMDEATVNAYGAFDDVLDSIKANIDAIHTGMASYFLSDFTSVASEVDDLTATFNRFLHGDATAEDVAKEAGDVVTAVVDAVRNGTAMINQIIEELRNSDDPTVRAIGEMLASIRDAAVDLYDKREDIKTGVTALLGLWTAGKITSALKNVTSFASALGSLVTNGINLMRHGKGIAEATQTVLGGAGGTGGTAAAGIPTVAQAAGKVIKSPSKVAMMVNAVKNASIAAIPVAAMTGGLMLYSAAQDKYVSSGQYDKDFRRADESNTAGLWESMQAYVANMADPDRTPESGKAVLEAMEKGFLEAYGEVRGKAVMDSFLSRLQNYQTNYRIENGEYDMSVLPEEDLEDVLGEGYETIVHAQITPADDAEYNLRDAVSRFNLVAPVQLVPTMGGPMASSYMMGSGGVQVTGIGSTANLTVNLDGRQIAYASAPYMDKILARRVGP